MRIDSAYISAVSARGSYFCMYYIHDDVGNGEPQDRLALYGLYSYYSPCTVLLLHRLAINMRSVHDRLASTC